jgi:hypothetical protein
VEERESEKREEVVASKNNYLTRQLYNYYMSCYCYATQNILFYMHKLNYIVLIDNLSDNSMYMLSVESTQI